MMKNTDDAISALAKAFCSLETRDEAVYVKALQSLVTLAISEEKLRASRSVERDIAFVGQIIQTAKTGRQAYAEAPSGCRRQAERRKHSANGRRAAQT